LKLWASEGMGTYSSRRRARATGQPRQSEWGQPYT
jgi:hypothetical protein